MHLWVKHLRWLLVYLSYFGGHSTETRKLFLSLWLSQLQTADMSFTTITESLYFSFLSLERYQREILSPKLRHAYAYKNILNYLHQHLSMSIQVKAETNLEIKTDTIMTHKLLLLFSNSQQSLDYAMFLKYSHEIEIFKNILDVLLGQ